jgi:signal transduction histidine kinase
LIEFRDTGQGMPLEQRRQRHSSLLSSTKHKGTGLGLAIVSRVVETHRGKVRILSRPGLGTAIIVTLPA